MLEKYYMGVEEFLEPLISLPVLSYSLFHPPFHTLIFIACLCATFLSTQLIIFSHKKTNSSPFSNCPLFYTYIATKLNKNIYPFQNVSVSVCIINADGWTSPQTKWFSLSWNGGQASEFWENMPSNCNVQPGLRTIDLEAHWFLLGTTIWVLRQEVNLGSTSAENTCNRQVVSRCSAQVHELSWKCSECLILVLRINRNERASSRVRYLQKTRIGCTIKTLHRNCAEMEEMLRIKAF